MRRPLESWIALVLVTALALYLCWLMVAPFVWGAGILKGWTSSDLRPRFNVVTGISAGALLASGALLEDDTTLEEVFTTTRTRDVHRKRFFLMIPFSNSLYETKPLRAMIRKYLPDARIRDIGELHNAGHRIYVASVNLDSGRLVIWNLGKIAAGKKYQLYRDVVYASAAAPGLYPPVEIGGRMHVDGGARAQLFFDEFLMPSMNQLADRKNQGEPLSGRLWVIINGEIGLDDTTQPNCLLPILTRSLSCLLDANGVAGRHRVWHAAQAARMEPRYTAVPRGHGVPAFEFDPAAMSKLFNLGECYGRMARWETALPGGYMR